MSSFEAMRHHQRKIYLPLAIVVTITFVFWGVWSGSQSGCTALDQSAAGLDEELVRVGQDLQKAGLIEPPPRRIYEEQAQKDLAHVEDGQRERRVREEAGRRCQEYYRSAGMRLHHLPLKEGERLGVQVSDQDLGARIRQFVENVWGHKEFSDKAYREELSARDLNVQRFEALILGQMIRERLGDLLTVSAGAFESERYYVYARERQRVRVQYFQRSPGEFVAQVQVKPGEPPAATPAEKTPAKTGEKAAEPADAGKKAGETDAAPAPPAAPAAGKSDQPPPEKKEPPKEEVGVLYEGEIPKKFEERCKRLKEGYGYKDDKDFEWPGYLPGSLPDIFTEARAGVESLVALSADFEAGVKVTAKEVEDYYKDNRKEFEEKPPEPTEKTPKADPKAEPKVKPLAEVRKDIEKKLLKRHAADAAAKALDAALKEYNDLAPDKRPKLAELAAKHKSLRAEPPAAGTLEELEERKYLDGRDVELAEVFDRAKRTALAGKLTERRSLDDDLGFLALRVTEFHPVAMMSFEQAREGFTCRLKHLEAWKLAKQAIGDDRKALEAGKLDPQRVRESRLLGPGDETSDHIAGFGLTVGEASQPYEYKQLLGPEADAEERREKEREKAREGKKKPPREQKTLQQRVTEAVDTDQRNFGRFRGYRVVVLAERQLPSFEEFARDRSWRQRWSPGKLPEYYLRLMRQNGRLPGDIEWREDFLRDYYEARYDQLMTRG